MGLMRLKQSNAGMVLNCGAAFSRICIFGTFMQKFKKWFLEFIKFAKVTDTLICISVDFRDILKRLKDNQFLGRQV